MVAGWVERIRASGRALPRLLDDPTTGTPRWSTTSTGPQDLSAIDFLRGIGKHFSVNRMLDREAVAARLRVRGISYTEFSYQLLQSNDYLELFRRHDCTLQTGGSDQWGNIVAGVDLIRRVTGDHVHALTTPLLTKADGSKFGKTEGGALWLDPELTSPYAFYQFWINVEDAIVPALLRTLDLPSPRGDRGSWKSDTAERPHAARGPTRTRSDLTTLVHGADETDPHRERQQRALRTW